MPERDKSSKPDSGRGFDWWLLAIIVIPCLYFLPELLGYSVFAGIDTSRLNMPLRFFDRTAFASGHLPLWNPYVFAGFPNLAESESGVFYPGNIFIHMPGDFFHWYSVEVIVHFMIAGAGFYTWMRIQGVSKPVSAFLAATYLTSPFLVFHITALGLFTSIVWLPWYLVLFESGLKGPHPVRTGLWLALFLGIMLVSGSPQAAFLGCMALILYGLGKIIAQPDGRSRSAMFLRCIAVLVPSVIAPIIAAIQILPTFELTSVSERAATTSIEFYRIGTWLTIPKLNSLFIFPALENGGDIQDYASSLCFMGVVPFVFAVAGIFTWQKNGRILFPLLFAGVIALILAFGLNLRLYHYLILFPPFSIFRYPGRFAFVALTLFLPLSAPAIDYLVGRFRNVHDNFSRWWPGIFVGSGIVIIAGTIGIFMPGAVKAGSLVGVVLAALMIILMLFLKPGAEPYKRKSLAITALIFILGGSLIAQIVLMYPFSRFLTQKRASFDRSLAFYDDLRADFGEQDEIPRILMAGSFYLMDPDALSHLGFTSQDNIWDNMSGNASGLRGVTALNGLTPLNQNNWKLVLRDMLQSRIDTVIARSEEMGEPKIPDEISLRIFRIVGADYILLEGNDWTVPGYELWRDDLALPFHEGLCVYRSIPGIVPDAYFVDCVTTGTVDFARFTNWIGSDESDCENQALVDTGTPGETWDEFVNYETGSGPLDPKNPPMGAVITETTRGFNFLRYKIQIDGDTPRFFVTGENFYPGWKAYIDGEETEYFEADFLLGGVLVPSGEHQVEIRYKPHSVLVGAYGTLGGVVVWLVLMGVVMLVHRSGKSTIIPQINEDEPCKPGK